MMTASNSGAPAPPESVSVKGQVLEIWNVAQDPRQNAIIPPPDYWPPERNKPQR